MAIPRHLTLRIAIAALIWASALLAPAAAAPIAIQPAHESPAATTLAAPAAYRDITPGSGEPTPGPTDPNAPAF